MNDNFKDDYSLLERDKIKYQREIYEEVDNIEYDDLAKIKYYRACGKKDYVSELLEFFEELRNNERQN